MIKNIINILIIIILVILKVSFFNTLPILKILNPVLIFIIYLAIKNDKYLIILSFIAGYLLDLYSHYTFGINTLAIISTAILTNYIYFNILTSHHLIPLIFLFFFNIFYFHFTSILIISILSFLKISPQTNLITIATSKIIISEILYTIIIITMLYLINKFLQRKLSVIFLK